ncbi:hypothetical protein GSI_13772 [Ganoderma sinense ZZ0214-1]|uniref:Uncharacterized protein n=1 Tax=Ganoderma sinense ZZ0214-1 TaxID=1077348 RepID=A0A2G8RRA4_9APHY|nr:hypothetical protein GSI_13772 [Ganoderma sinense ZZ0214-1]
MRRSRTNTTRLARAPKARSRESVAPGTNFFKIPTKTAHCVFNTPLNGVWDDTVTPQNLASTKAHGLQYSALKTARFLTVENGKDETLGAGAVTDVVVEWYEASVVTSTAGLYP